MPRPKHPTRREAAKTEKEICHCVDVLGMTKADTHRKLNATKRIQAIGGLSYQDVLYFLGKRDKQKAA